MDYKASSPDSIPVVFLENCEPKLLCVLNDIFNITLSESCFLDFRKVPSMNLVFKNIKRGLQVKTIHLFSLLFVVNKIFETLVNHMLVNQHNKCDLFLISSMVLGLLI